MKKVLLALGIALFLGSCGHDTNKEPTEAEIQEEAAYEALENEALDLEFDVKKANKELETIDSDIDAELNDI